MEELPAFLFDSLNTPHHDVETMTDWQVTVDKDLTQEEKMKLATMKRTAASRPVFCSLNSFFMVRSNERCDQSTHQSN